MTGIGMKCGKVDGGITISKQDMVPPSIQLVPDIFDVSLGYVVLRWSLAVIWTVELDASLIKWTCTGSMSKLCSPHSAWLATDSSPYCQQRQT